MKENFYRCVIFFQFQPPICENGINLIRRKRQVVEIDERDNAAYDIDEKPHSINVYSGLYVNEAEDLDEDELNDELVDVVRLNRNLQ